MRLPKEALKKDGAEMFGLRTWLELHLWTLLLQKIILRIPRSPSFNVHHHFDTSSTAHLQTTALIH